MSNIGRGIVAALVVAAACVSSTRTFVSLQRLRVKLIETPTDPREQSVRVLTNALGQLVEIHQPLALIVRLANRDREAHEFALAADGAPVCRTRVPAESSRRVDCVIAGWRADGEHDITIDGPSTAWTVNYLEVATHHGNTTGANFLVILPRASTHYVSPSVLFTAIVCLALAATLLLVPSASFPRWAVLVHQVLSGVLFAIFTAVQISPWASNYRVVLASWTLILWLGVICLPRVWTLVRWATFPDALPKHTSTVWARRAIVATGVLAVFWIVASARLHDAYHGNYSGFLEISRRQFEANPLLNNRHDRDDIRQSLLLLDNDGYDAQFMYFATFDPLMRAFRSDPVKYRGIVDAVPYRYGRIGFSLLTWLGSGGNWRRYPATMVWLVLMALFVSALALATLADHEHLSPLVGALVVLVPGFWQSMQDALPEPLAAATLIAGVVCASRNRRVPAALFFAASLIIRETGVVLVCAIVGAAVVSGQRRNALTLALIALMPVLLWRLYVGWTIFPDWGLKGFLDHPADLGWPFSGFLDLWRAIQRGDFDPSMSRAGIAYPALLMYALLLAAALAIRAPSAVNMAALCYAVLAVSLNYRMIWVHVGNGQRGTYELFVAVALSTVAIRSYPRPLRMAVASFWCAAGAFVFYGAYDAEFIRTALSVPN